jgi:hypothetical protein
MHCILKMIIHGFILTQQEGFVAGSMDDRFVLRRQRIRVAFMKRPPQGGVGAKTRDVRVGERISAYFVKNP